MSKKYKTDAKALRWVAAQFPLNPEPKNKDDQLCNALHLISSAGSTDIEELTNLTDTLMEYLNGYCWCCANSHALVPGSAIFTCTKQNTTEEQAKRFMEDLEYLDPGSDGKIYRSSCHGCWRKS